MSNEVWSIDDDIENADWLKQAWDLPPYMSKEFFEVIPYEQLEEFKTTATYKAAVENGLIYDDEWVGLDPADIVKEEKPAPTPSKGKDRITIIIHK